MKKSLLFIFTGIFLFVACSQKEKESEEKTDEPNQEVMYEEIIELEQKLFEKTEPDAVLAQQMIDKYVNYANKFHEDTNAPEFLFKAAEIAMNFGQPANSVNYLSRIEARYKEYDKYGACLFLKAYIYDYYLKDKEQAEKYYQKFIDEFPEHNLVEDANAALMFLDLDDAELIRKFEQMN